VRQPRAPERQRIQVSARGDGAAARLRADHLGELLEHGAIEQRSRDAEAGAGLASDSSRRSARNE